MLSTLLVSALLSAQVPVLESRHHEPAPLPVAPTSPKGFRVGDHVLYLGREEIELLSRPSPDDFVWTVRRVPGPSIAFNTSEYYLTPLPTAPPAPSKPTPEPLPVPTTPILPTPQATLQAVSVASYAASACITSWAAPATSYRVKSRVRVIRRPFFARRTYGAGSCQ